MSSVILGTNPADLKAALSLDQLNNTSDANKPVSTAQAAAIAAETSRAETAEAAKNPLLKNVTCNSQAAQFALTSADINIGDTVTRTDLGITFLVVDAANLGNSTGYRQLLTVSSGNTSTAMAQNLELQNLYCGDAVYVGSPSADGILNIWGQGTNVPIVNEGNTLVFGGGTNGTTTLEAGTFIGNYLQTCRFQDKSAGVGFFGYLVGTIPAKAVLSPLPTDGTATSAQTATAINAIQAVFTEWGLTQ